MTISGFVAGQPYETYEEYRKAKQREYRKVYKLRNAEKVAEKESQRRRNKYESDPAYRLRINARNTERYSRNPEPAKQRSAKVRKDNSANVAEYMAAYYERNKVSLQEYKRWWMKQNAASIASRNAARRALSTKATPKWANKDEINRIYAEAKRLGVHVDHIVPLNNPMVCGLHVEANLQLLSATENIRKGNKYACR